LGNYIRFGVGASGAGKAMSDIDKLRDSFEKLKKGGAGGFAIGAGAVAAGAAIAALGLAVSKAGEFIGDATAAALEEEVSIQKLGTALRANVKDWDGNTAAIEDVIKARMKLGFSDDEQRESLALLVAKTGDVTEALNIQRAAMDLARLKGIGLAEASKAIALGMGGSGRALKELGINVKDYANGQEILTAIQKKAAGQAEDYARTNAGKLLVSQVKVGEAMETFGAVTMPIVVSVMETAADVVTDLAGAFENAADFANDLTVATGGTVATTENLRDRVRESAAASLAHADALEQYAYSQHEAAAAADEGGLKYKLLGDTILGLGRDTETMERHVVNANDQVGQSWDTLVGRLKDDTDNLIDDVFDPIITANELGALNAEATAARRVIAHNKAGSAARREAQDTLDSVVQSQAKALLKLAETGDTTSAEYKGGLKSLKAYAATTSGAVRTSLNAVIAKIEGVGRAFHGSSGTWRVTFKGGPSGVTLMAAGGPVSKGQPVIVGDAGRPELFVPDSNGTILPRVPGASGGTAYGGGSITINFQTMFAPTAAQAQIAARAIIPELTREMRRQSIL